MAKADPEGSCGRIRLNRPEPRQSHVGKIFWRDDFFATDQTSEMTERTKNNISPFRFAMMCLKEI